MFPSHDLGGCEIVSAIAALASSSGCSGIVSKSTGTNIALLLFKMVHLQVHGFSFLFL